MDDYNLFTMQIRISYDIMVVGGICLTGSFGSFFRVKRCSE